MDIDRRTAIALSLTGAAALLGSKLSVAATEAQGKEIGPGVHYRMLGEARSPIPGFEKVTWEEVTWQPGAKFGPETMKNPMMCEILAGELESTHGGHPEPQVIKAGYTFACKVGMIENNVNKGTEVAVMRIVNLLPAA